MCFRGGGGGDGGAAAARAEEAARQERIRSGTASINQTFSQFDDNFFNQRKQSYLDYANPQLEDQYGKAQRELAFFLDRAGTTDSSIRAAKEADLLKLYDTNKRSVADQGLNFANEARNNIESARSDLIRTLSATADAGGAANQALSRAQALSQPQAYSPLAQLFADFTGALGTQAGLERAAALSGGAVKGRYNTGLFAPNSRAVTVST